MNDSRELYDAVVVGAGPAGSSAAIVLARRGFRVALLEKENFPREKPCGDGLTGEAIATLDLLGAWDLVRASAFETSGLTLASPTSATTCIPLVCWTIRRRELDAILVREAVRRGATLLQGEASAIRLVDPTRVTVECGKPQSFAISAQYCILATGCGKTLSTDDGYPQPGRSDAVAIRGYITAPSRCDRLLVSLERVVLPGYGWIFPLGDGIYNAGVLRTLDSGPVAHLRNSYQQFLQGSPVVREMVGRPSKTSVPIGARLRIGLQGQRPVHGRVLSAGEAMGATLPLSFEGVGPALQTGSWAGDCVGRALESEGPDALATYSVLVERSIRPIHGLLGAFSGVLSAALENDESDLVDAWVEEFSTRKVPIPLTTTLAAD